MCVKIWQCVEEHTSSDTMIMDMGNVQTESAAARVSSGYTSL